MAIFHLHISIISRGKGKSAVAAAAYRSGEYIINDYDGQIHDYTRKKGIAFKEILLPENAPEEFNNRTALWNSVEKIEKASNSQLAREVEFSLPVELSKEANIALAKDYVQKTFVEKGMCADICIHDAGDGKLHCHTLLTMRPFNEDGSWGGKQKKEYILDKSGNRIYDRKKRQYKCKSIPSTDWNEQTKAEEWREAWANFANAALKKTKLKITIDHRSYKRQGISKKPSIKLGVAAHQMEKRGIRTERGDINREIALTNQQMREIKARITKLEKWITEESLKDNTPTLKEVLKEIINREGRSQITNLKEFADVLNFLQDNKIFNMDDLEDKVSDIKNQFASVQDNRRKIERRTTTLRKHIEQGELVKNNRKYKRQYDELYAKYTEALKSKNLVTRLRAQSFLDKARDYYEANRAPIVLFEAADRYMRDVMQKHYDPNKLPPIAMWKKELSEKTSQQATLLKKSNTLRDETKKVERIQRSVKEILRSEEQPQIKPKQRTVSMER